MYKVIGYTIAAAAFVGGLVYAVNEAFSMPDVHFSYSTNECVEVVNYTEENFDCYNYPEKFNHVWVE